MRLQPAAVFEAHQHGWPAERKAASFWLVSRKALELTAPSHVYVFVNLRPPDGTHEYFVVPSREFARKTRTATHPRSTWFELRRTDIQRYRDRWKVFGVVAERDGK